MQLITLHSQVKPNGILSVQLPNELKNQNVVITIQAVANNPDSQLGVDLGLPEGFFAQTAGALAGDDSFFRHPQSDI
jgi:trans-aconitate methyltransferase